MTEEEYFSMDVVLYDDLIHGLDEIEHLFFKDNQDTLKRLICKMAEVQSAVITLDLQRGIIVAANTTTREHFGG